MARSREVIKQQLLDELYRGEVKASCDGELKAVIGFREYSNNAVQRAMGSLIKDGLVVRHRPPMLECYSEREVTWYLNPQRP